MNPVRIRDRLKDARKAGAVTVEELHRGLPAPLFVLPGDFSAVLSDDEADWLRANGIMGESGEVVKCTPFGETIIESGDFTFFHWRYSDATRILTMSHDGENWMLTTCRHSGGKGSIQAAIYQNGRVMPPPEIIPEKFHRLANMPNSMLAAFCFAVFSSSQSVIKVEAPKREHKSATWRLSREHYLILHPRQAMKCAAQKRGPTSREITLAAHWRKAHLRLLSSPKFTAKRGQKVMVKHAWVGPDSWRGIDGKIYKVVELKHEQPN